MSGQCLPQWIETFVAVLEKLTWILGTYLVEGENHSLQADLDLLLCT